MYVDTSTVWRNWKPLLCSPQPAPTMYSVSTASIPELHTIEPRVLTNQAYARPCTGGCLQSSQEGERLPHVKQLSIITAPTDFSLCCDMDALGIYDCLLDGKMYVKGEKKGAVCCFSTESQRRISDTPFSFSSQFTPAVQKA